jgi:hypothetical protein
MRSPSLSGSGRIMAVCRNENVKVLRPRPPARTSTVSSVKPGLRASSRSA